MTRECRREHSASGIFSDEKANVVGRIWSDQTVYQLSGEKSIARAKHTEIDLGIGLSG